MLKSAQLNHQLLAEKYRSLRIEYGTLAAEFRSKRSNDSQAQRGALTGESREISLAGGRFSVVGELWLTDSMLDIPCPKEVDPLSPGRYADPTTRSRTITAELYQDLPPHLQDALANVNRRKSFKSIVRFHVLIRCALVTDQIGSS